MKKSFITSGPDDLSDLSVQLLRASTVQSERFENGSQLCTLHVPRHNYFVLSRESAGFLKSPSLHVII